MGTCSCCDDILIAIKYIRDIKVLLILFYITEAEIINMNGKVRVIINSGQDVEIVSFNSIFFCALIFSLEGGT